jgi:fructose-1,6-bisphosphatase/inositol monophosphatase family enzyme
MNSALNTTDLLRRLRELQAGLRDRLMESMQSASLDVWSRVARDQTGDTIFGIDEMIERDLLDRCAEWGRQQSYVLIAEGLADKGITMVGSGDLHPAFRLIVDPIDGTRGLMHDKRSAWCLMGIAPDSGPATRLSDIQLAVMTELPTTRQATSDTLWAVRGRGAHCQRLDMRTGETKSIPVVPSGSADLRHGFATICQFFQGGGAVTGALADAILHRAHGPWNPEKADVFTDQYISSGGQLAEIALGRDRFVLDARPLVYQSLGVQSSLCSRPYDLCAMLIAEEAGVIVRDPFGNNLDAPLDTTTNLAFAAYANQRLADRMIPIVAEEVRRLLAVN